MSSVHRSEVDVPAITEHHQYSPQEMTTNLCVEEQDLL